MVFCGFGTIMNQGWFAILQSLCEQMHRGGPQTAWLGLGSLVCFSANDSISKFNSGHEAWGWGDEEAQTKKISSMVSWGALSLG